MHHNQTNYTNKIKLQQSPHDRMNIAADKNTNSDIVTIFIYKTNTLNNYQ